jgi:glycosyltransferase involved in cell wall biosynthesis
MTQRAIDVSVPMITYNHAAFIRQAMESVLGQETSYAWELVVGDDCSTDGTAEIVREIAARHPERVRVLETEANLGANRNFQRTANACRGRYLAMLEGDDYWRDPAKIEKQASFLDRNPAAALTGGGVLVWYEPEKKVIGKIAEEAEGLRGLEDILGTNFLSTCAVMIRKEALVLHPKLAPLAIGDWPSWILASTHGQLHVSPEILATYRIHAGGVWSGKSPVYRKAKLEEMFAVIRELVPADTSSARAIADALLRTQIREVNEMIRRRMLRDWLAGIASLRHSLREMRQVRFLAQLLDPLRAVLLRK